MGRERYLIDSNVVIDYLGNKLPHSGKELMDGVIDSTPIVSVITEIEVLGYKTDGKVYRILEDFFEDSLVIGVTSEIAKTCIRLRKERRIKLPDAIIAATALDLGYTLITRNISDFNFIKDLELLNPHEIV